MNIAEQNEVNKNVEGGRISDNDLELGWETLKDVILQDCEPEKPLLVENQCTKEDHWVGGSSIKCKMHYFVVSDYMVSHETNLFPIYFSSLCEDSPNTPNMIPVSARNTIRNQVNQYRNNFVTKIRIVDLSRNEGKWVGIAGNGQYEELNLYWLFQNFASNWPDYYTTLFNKDNIGKTFVVPEGK